MGRKPKWGSPIDGVLLLDKPAGMTSNQALQKCKRLIDAKKGGHTGALDPLATGLLPLCFGQATKISSFLLGSDKSYAVCARLGEITDTGDADGQVIETHAVKVNQLDVTNALSRYIGEYDQVPPMYSALKVNGQPLYKLARKGIEIERKPRRVTAHDIRFVSMLEHEICFEVDCSSGFYVRSLVEDIGQLLGCGAHVQTLRRTQIREINLQQSIGLPQFEALESAQARIELLRPADQLIEHFPSITLDAQQVRAIQYGQKLELAAEEHFSAPENIRLYDADANFLGLGKFKHGQLAPTRLFNM